MVRQPFTLRIISGEKKMNAPYDPALIALAGVEAADAPVEGFSLMPPQSFEADRISTQPRAVTQAVDFIHDNYAAGLSLSDIAAAAHLSPFHLSRIFKKATGVSPHQYLLQVRVNSVSAAGAGEQRPLSTHGWRRRAVAGGSRGRSRICRSEPSHATLQAHAGRDAQATAPVKHSNLGARYGVAFRQTNLRQSAFDSAAGAVTCPLIPCN